MDKSIAEKKISTYNKQLLKSIERRTLIPVANNEIIIQNQNKRAQTIADKTSEAMLQKYARSPSPKEEPKQPGYTLQEQSRRYNDKVNKNYD